MPNSEALVRALCLVDNHLIDSRLSRANLQTVIETRMQSLGFADDRIASDAVIRVLKKIKDKPPLDNIRQLNSVMFELHQGMPVIHSNLLFQHLNRLIDSDTLRCLHEDLSLADDENYNWAAIPVRDGHLSNSVLNQGSIDTHIHLGGTLPPLFYWVLLMTGQVRINIVARYASQRRGYAENDLWHTAVTQAIWMRLLLAKTVQQHSANQAFPYLPNADDPIWEFADQHTLMHIDTLLSKCFAESRELIAQFNTTEQRLHAIETKSWTFVDPLRFDFDQTSPHYAAGERRLLVAVAQYLRSPAAEPEKKATEALLFKYLRVKNACHQVLVHEYGTDGLMRFIETFVRRGFYFNFSNNRKRKARLLLHLERDRMKAALDMQLNQGFSADSEHKNNAIVRRVEMRVSLPENNHCLRTLHAWLEGIKQHIHPYHDDCCLYAKGTEHQHIKDQLCCWQHLKSGAFATDKQPVFHPSQVGLLFHMIKFNWGNDQQLAYQASESARKLAGVLKCYPYLRSSIIGLDAAGDERSSPPRNFVQAYRHLQHFQQTLRPEYQHPPVRLGWTYHVGEDYADLVTALRHLDEVSCLILHQDGGRLGHALALGESPKRFYRRKQGAVELSVGAHLLNLVWMRGRLIAEHQEKNSAWLENEISRYLGVESSKENINQCYQLMGLDKPGKNIALESELLTELGFEGDAEQIVELEVDKQWINLAKYLQQLLRQRFAFKKICIEANPTSNLIIGDYRHYKDLPYQKLVKARLALSINTDDPGLFICSLAGEFSAIYNALAADGKMSHREILCWLDDRVFDAMQSSFLGEHVPIGREHPVLNIEKASQLFRFGG